MHVYDSERKEPLSLGHKISVFTKNRTSFAALSSGECFDGGVLHFLRLIENRFKTLLGAVTSCVWKIGF